jgi:hypothetical protein
MKIMLNNRSNVDSPKSLEHRRTGVLDFRNAMRSGELG